MKKFFSLILCCAIGFAVAAQDKTALDSYISKALADFKQEGMTVGVLQNGELVYSNAFGYSNLDLKTEANPYTVFELASLSKAFTAASIGILVDNGLLKWDDKVIDHFPEFRMYDDYVTNNTTVLDLLCHRNGYNTFDGDLLWYGTEYSAEEIAARFANLKPKHGYRTEYGYSNINFINAALLVEKVSRISWPQFVHDSIFTPLQMHDSYSELQPFLRLVNKAYPHVKGNVIEHQDFENAKGAVGVKSNIKDLAKWANMWLQKGMLPDSTYLLEPKTVHQIFSLHTPQATSQSDIDGGNFFKAAGLGWFVSMYQGKRIMKHSGGLPGFILNLALLPEENIAVIVLTNGETILPFAATNYLLDQYLQIEDGKDWAALYLQYQNNNKAEKKAPTTKNKPRPTINPNALVGTYEDAMYGKATIALAGKNLKLTLLPSKKYFFSEMTFVKDSSYHIKFADPFLPEGTVNIELDKNGVPTGFTISLPNPDFHFHNLNFKKLP